MSKEPLTVKEAATKLVERLEAIHADSRYQSVWTSYMLHGGDYTNGPKYDKELADLKKALILEAVFTPLA